MWIKETQVDSFKVVKEKTFRNWNFAFIELSSIQDSIQSHVTSWLCLILWFKLILDGFYRCRCIILCLKCRHLGNLKRMVEWMYRVRSIIPAKIRNVVHFHSANASKPMNIDQKINCFLIYEALRNIRVEILTNYTQEHTRSCLSSSKFIWRNYGT